MAQLGRQQHQRSASGSSSTSSGLHFLSSPSPFGDTTLTKVFVGGLAWETDNDALRRHFEGFGDILEAVVISDKVTGRSKGYGFVTFRDPESARRSCADPAPIIDGRRANCNLASLGRPRLPPPLAHLRSPGYFLGGAPVAQGTYLGSPAYHQVVPLNYQQGFAYPQYGYTMYGPEYMYPQNAYSPYTGQQYFQIYGVPGSVNTTVYPFGQSGQPPPSGHGYTALQGYAVPSHPLVQFSRPNVNGGTAAPLSAVQAQYPAVPVPAHPQFIIPPHLPQFTQGAASDQTAC